MKIYLDVLFITNTVITLMYISALAKITHTSAKKARVRLAALLGGLSGMLLIFNTESFWEAVMITVAKLAAIISIVSIAFGIKQKKRILRLCLLYGVLNLIFGGCCLIIWQISGGRVIYMRNYTVYFDISLLDMLICAALAYCAVSVYDAVTEKAFRRSCRYKTKYTVGDYEITVPAVADSGNALVDIFTGAPVVIFCCSELFDHFDLDHENYFRLNGFRLIPCRTINGESLIPVTSRGKVTVTDDRDFSKEIRCCIGVVRSDGSSSRAIFDPALLQ